VTTRALSQIKNVRPLFRGCIADLVEAVRDEAATRQCTLGVEPLHSMCG
jgi:hypothetical protein